MTPSSSPLLVRPLHRLRLAALAACALLLGACGSSPASWQSSDFAYSPQPLFFDGQHMDVEVMGQLPPKSVPPKALVTLTPCLFWEGGGLLGDSLTVQGERVEGMNQIVSHKHGGRVRLTARFPYREGMEGATLVVYAQTAIEGRLVGETAVPLDSGVNTTRTLLFRAIAECGRPATDPAIQAALRAFAQGRMAVVAAQLAPVGGDCALLADILAQNYASARQRLSKPAATSPATSEPTALRAYLQALLGARTDNAALLRQGLQQLVRLGDKGLLRRARHDVEFRNMKEIVDEIVQ